MNNNDEQQFDQLRKLLALKKHEVPPPGYFNRLPGKILARIETSEMAAVQSSWWDWMVARFDARPILACAYGFTISGLLLMGFRLSQVLQTAEAEPTSPALGGGWLAATPDPVTIQPNSFLQTHFANPAGLVNFSSSVEPVVELNPQQRSKQTGMFQQVSYTVGK